MMTDNPGAPGSAPDAALGAVALDRRSERAGRPNAARPIECARNTRSHMALRHGDRVPPGAGHLRFLESTDVPEGCGEGVADIEVVMLWFVLLWPRGNSAELDVGGRR